MRDKRLFVTVTVLAVLIPVAGSSKPAAKHNPSPPTGGAASSEVAADATIVTAIQTAFINDFSKRRIVVPAIEVAAAGITNGYVEFKEAREPTPSVGPGAAKGKPGVTCEPPWRRLGLRARHRLLICGTHRIGAVRL